LVRPGSAPICVEQGSGTSALCVSDAAFANTLA